MADETVRTQRPRLPLWLSLVLLVALGAGIGVLASALTGDGDDEPTAVDAPSMEDAESIDATRNELLGLLRAGRGSTVHAVYEQSDGSRVEVWRKGERTRTEATATGDDGTVEQVVSIHGPDQDVTCRRAGDAAWACEPSTPAPTFEEAIEDELAMRDVTAAGEATVAGRPVQCYLVSGEGQSSEVCVDDNGLIARLGDDGGDAVLELVEVDDDVDDGVFTPPA